MGKWSMKDAMLMSGDGWSGHSSLYSLSKSCVTERRNTSYRLQRIRRVALKWPCVAFIYARKSAVVV